MNTTNPSDLVALLRSRILKVRTGLWLMPLHYLGKEEDEAARLGIDALDIRRPILADLPPGARFIGLSVVSLVEILDGIAQARDGSDCVLVYNLDLALARLRRQERLEVWQNLFGTFGYRARALLLTMPANADHLLPTSESMMAWRNDRRLAT
ncbi:MAG: hypothetical protein ACK47M_08650 [Caldilinea sp.]